MLISNSFSIYDSGAFEEGDCSPWLDIDSIVVDESDLCTGQHWRKLHLVVRHVDSGKVFSSLDSSSDVYSELGRGYTAQQPFHNSSHEAGSSSSSSSSRSPTKPQVLRGCAPWLTGGGGGGGLQTGSCGNAIQTPPQQQQQQQQQGEPCQSPGGDSEEQSEQRAREAHE
jgi:hypothetical protein